ncbi:MAG: hypothetical protein KC592_01925 [Nitrospira sp.]|nr:hypothetical protein [Nitrospira sp.]HBP89021.1 hypothetical protein [Nitrospiraceae bacterium]HNP29926.1 hypothetical protein [Nitrospirales bacterium]
MAVKKKSIRQTSPKRTLSSNKKRTPSSKKGTLAPKKGSAAPKKGAAARKQKPAARKTTQPKRARASRAPRVTAQTIEALNERLDIMLPEVMFRIAAIEHLLVKNQLCLYDELINARQFIQEQERT